MLIGIFLIAILVGALLYKDHAPTSKANIVYLPDANGQREFLGPKAPVILNIDIKGIIGAEKLTSEKIENILLDSRESLLSNRVKGILLNINSPGGTIRDSNGIYNLLKTYKERYNIPIYAYIDDVCASGSYQIASVADEIYSVNSGIIGSVGVLVNTFNISKLLDKVGVEAISISAGKDKNLLNPLVPREKGDEQEFSEIANVLYENLLNMVVKNRIRLSKEKLTHDYGAKVFSADKAKEYGFIDASDASYEQALSALVKATEIEENVSYQVIKLQRCGFFSNIMQAKLPFFTGKITHQLDLKTGMPPELNQKFLYLYTF